MTTLIIVGAIATILTTYILADLELSLTKKDENKKENTLTIYSPPPKELVNSLPVAPAPVEKQYGSNTVMPTNKTFEGYRTLQTDKSVEIADVFVKLILKDIKEGTKIARKSERKDHKKLYSERTSLLWEELEKHYMNSIFVQHLFLDCKLEGLIELKQINLDAYRLFVVTMFQLMMNMEKNREEFEQDEKKSSEFRKNLHELITSVRKKFNIMLY